MGAHYLVYEALKTLNFGFKDDGHVIQAIASDGLNFMINFYRVFDYDELGPRALYYLDFTTVGTSNMLSIHAIALAHESIKHHALTA